MKQFDLFWLTLSIVEHAFSLLVLIPMIIVFGFKFLLSPSKTIRLIKEKRQ